MDADPAARIHLDRPISPERSLPMTGFKVLLGVMILINLVIGTIFLLMGAWPAPIFLGLDVLGVWIAFRVSYRRAATRERVVITADQVRVLREFGGRVRTIWASPTAFTGLSLDRSERYGVQVRLTLSGKRLSIGQGLGPKAREDLAEAIQAGIGSARAERYPAP